MSANQQQHVHTPRGIKETARTMDPSEVIEDLQLATMKILKDMFVVRVFKCNIAYQLDDDEFVSKCN